MDVQFLDKVVDAPCCQRQVHGLVSAETCGGLAVAVFDLVVDVPVMQFIDKVGRHRDLAATSPRRQSEVPQIRLLTFLRRW